VENEQLRVGGGCSSDSNNITSTRISQLEKKLMTQQEELTDLHKRKGENSQMIVDLNVKLTEQTKVLTDKENRFEFYK